MNDLSNYDIGKVEDGTFCHIQVPNGVYWAMSRAGYNSVGFGRTPEASVNDLIREIGYEELGTMNLGE